MKDTEQHNQKWVFDPTSAEFADDPYPIYARLRNFNRPLYFEGSDALLLSRFSDVEAAARNNNLVRSTESFLSPQEIEAKQRASNWQDMPNHERFVQSSLLDSDGEVHDRLRLIVMRHLSRRFVEQQRSMIESFVNQILDELLDRKEFDFISDLACQLPGHIIGRVLGVPDEDCPQLRVWSENIVQFFDIGRTEEHKQLAEQSTTDFYHYLLELISERKQTPKNDLTSALIAESKAGNLSETELISTCMLILMAGHGSTIDVMGSGMLALLRNPSEFAKLDANPSLTPYAVQEMFRFESPLPFFHRFANKQVEVMGRTYPVGTKFGLLYGAANRDPNQFESADQFLVDRKTNRHVAFGRGPHLCLGNHLSRLDMEIVYGALIKRVSSFEVLKQPEFKPGLSARGLKELRLRVQAK